MHKVENTGALHHLGLVAGVALMLAALALPLHPAKAQFGMQVAPVGIGVGPYYPSYPYYRPGYFYHPYQHRHDYRHDYWFNLA